jgi:Calpain family cysteine protease
MGNTIDQTDATPRYYELDTNTWGPPPPTKTPAPSPEIEAICPKTVAATTYCGAVSRSALYVGGITPDDIRQGPVGDCTLQAVLGSLARTDEGRGVIRSRIEVIHDAEGNESAYRVHIFKKDAAAGTYNPVTVTVSVCQLCDTGPMGWSGGDAKIEVWPRVLEKAILDANGRTCNDVKEAFGMLTGRAATDLSTRDATFETKLKLGFEAKKVQTLVTTGAFKTDQTSPYILKVDHCYTVMAVAEREGKTVVLLRNPWGYDSPSVMPIEDVKKYFPAYSEASVK